VEVVKDPQSDRRGSYGRILAYIEYNQTDLGEELMEKGYARVYNSRFKRKEEYHELEKGSRNKIEVYGERGLWRLVTLL
jgi:micrococcal nuclease